MCHLQEFCSKVKSHIQISTATLPSVRRAKKHRRRKSSEAALVQTFLVLRQAWFDMWRPAGPVLLPQGNDAARLLDSTSQWGFFLNQTKSLFGASTAQLLWVLSDSELAVTTAQVNIGMSKGQNLLSSLHSNWCYLAYPSYYWGKWNVPYQILISWHKYFGISSSTIPTKLNTYRSCSRYWEESQGRQNPSLFSGGLNYAERGWRNQRRKNFEVKW